MRGIPRTKTEIPWPRGLGDVHDGHVITREQAIRRVAERLAVESRQVPRSERAFYTVGEARDLGFGWLVDHNVREWPGGRPYPGYWVGGGAHLVDAETGTLFFVPGFHLGTDDWMEGFLIRYKGRVIPDAIEVRVREVLLADGRLAALRELRRLAPALRIDGARAYIDVLQNGGHPPRLLPVPPSHVGQLDPVPADFDPAEFAHMWTTERDDWYIAMTRTGGALPIHRGTSDSALLICDDRTANAVIAHMVEAGVEVVIVDDASAS